MSCTTYANTDIDGKWKAINLVYDNLPADSAGMTGTTVPGPKDIKRSDFTKIDLKGRGQRYYFSFKDNILDHELTLEPCMHGFDVALYHAHKSEIYSEDRHPDLKGKKECTNLKIGVFKNEKVHPENAKEKELSFDKLAMEDMMHGTLERSERVWDKALSIANKLYRIERNGSQLRKWNIIKGEKDNAEKAQKSVSAQPLGTYPGNADKDGTWTDTTKSGYYDDANSAGDPNVASMAGLEEEMTEQEFTKAAKDQLGKDEDPCLRKK